MNRHTLEGRINNEVGMKAIEFAKVIGVHESTLSRWHSGHKIILCLIISGYKREVLCQRD